MSHYSDFKRAIYNWVNANTYKHISDATKKPTYWGDQNFPSSKGSYLVILPPSNVQVLGIEYESPIDDEGNRDLIIDRMATFSFNAYGPGAMDVINDLNDSLMLQSTKELFYSTGISAHSTLLLADVSAQLDKEFMEHAVLEINFSYRPAITESIDHVAAVEVTAQVYADIEDTDPLIEIEKTITLEQE